MRNLVSVVFFAAVASGGSGGPASWLGHKVDPLQTPFCRTHGCTLQSVRQNDENTMGWHNGSTRTYVLRGGSRLEVDVRPAGWVSNARLQFTGTRQPNGVYAMRPADYSRAAEFLSAVTGRRFRTEAIAACQRAGVALGVPDNYGPNEPLARWKTSGGLSFKARCGINSYVGVWAGYMQE